MIPIYQQGGAFDAIFTTYTPIEAPRLRATSLESSKKSSKKEDSDDKGKLTEKDLFLMVKDLDGLPNDMRVLVNNLTNVFKMAELSGEKDINSLATTYLSSLYRLKQAKFNKEAFDNTYKRAVENGSLNDIAITLSGQVLALDENNKIVPFSSEEWVKVKKSNKYLPLTNSNILWMRSHDPKYANNNKILQVVENGIGLDQINKMIKDRFTKLGQNEISQENFYQKGAAIKGAEIIEQMLLLGPEGYYKILSETSKTDLAQIDAALAYIYSTLPANAKARLAIETSDGAQESVHQVIKAMIFGTLDSKTKLSILYIGTDEKLTGKTKSGNTTGDEDNYAIKVIKGYGTPENFGIDLGDGNLTMVHANTMPFVGKDDNIIGTGRPISDLMESSLGGQLDTRSMSIGGGLISPYNLKHIINGDGKIRTIDYPCIVNENGTVIPALSADFRAKKKKAEEAIKQAGINPYNTNPEYIAQHYLTINQIYQTNALPPPYKLDGSLNEKTWARFVLISVATDGDVVKNADKSLLQEITNDDTAENVIAAILESDKGYSKSTGWFGDTFYEGTLWVRLLPGYNAATATQKADASVTRLRDEYDQAIANRTSLTTLQFY